MQDNSPGIHFGQLYTALAEARKEFGAISKTKTANVRSEKGSYSYRYADLSDIIDATAGALAKHGLSIIQEPELSFDNDAWIVIVHGTIAHKSGEHMRLISLPMPVSQRTPQGVGAAITFARRYQMSSILNIAADEDTDGDNANEEGSKMPQGARAAVHRYHPTREAPNASQRAATPATEPTNDAAEAAQPWDSAEPIDPDPAPSPAPRGVPITEPTLKRLHALGAQLYGQEWDAKRRELVEHVSHGAVQSSKDLTENEARTLCAGMEAKLAKLQQPDAKRRREAA